ncbi:MAG: FAD-dependent thymidylate synthase [Flavobacteriaceae bacterium]|nr:FAD-dependent thymidylate synthase [Flavobacteriaceae bacterium]
MRNSVELVGIYGSDLTHAMSAWTSTSRELDEEKLKRVPKLLKMLAEGSDGNPHGTPFEKSAIHFLVTAETASHIHLIKHRIGVSINAESARYKELTEDKYYIPTDWPKDWQFELDQHSEYCFKLYHDCLEDLIKKGFDRKRAKESARFFLPYGTQLKFDVMFNFRSFIHFLKLRNKKSAQYEIRQIASLMLRLVRENGSFEHSLKAWGF